jgi:hypothetical protein
MFKGMGKTILPHDRGIELIDNGEVSSRAQRNALKGESVDFKVSTSFVGQDSIMTDVNYVIKPESTNTHRT